MYVIKFRDINCPDEKVDATDVQERDRSYVFLTSTFIQPQQSSSSSASAPALGRKTEREVAMYPITAVRSIVLEPDLDRDVVVKTLANAIGFEVFNDGRPTAERADGVAQIITTPEETDRCVRAAERVLAELDILSLPTA